MCGKQSNWYELEIKPITKMYCIIKNYKIMGTFPVQKRTCGKPEAINTAKRRNSYVCGLFKQKSVTFHEITWLWWQLSRNSVSFCRERFFWHLAANIDRIFTLVCTLVLYFFYSDQSLSVINSKKCSVYCKNSITALS